MDVRSDQLVGHRSQAVRLIVWTALISGLSLWLWRGSAIVALTPYYRIRRSYPEIWDRFHDGLPTVGNPRLLDAVYWASIAVIVVGVPLLLWWALEPQSDDSDEPGSADDR